MFSPSIIFIYLFIIFAAGKEVLKQRENSHLVSVPHHLQVLSWDCGLACICMILKMFNKPIDNVYHCDLDFVQCGERHFT